MFPGEQRLDAFPFTDQMNAVAIDQHLGRPRPGIVI
jgi:hypothetical protein